MASETSPSSQAVELPAGAVHGNDALTQAIAALLQQARREIRLFAPYLDAAVFGSPSIAQALAAFAARHRRNRAHLLLEDTAQLQRDSGRLLDSVRRVADAAELRAVEENDRGARDLFVIADRAAFLVQEDIGRADAVVTTQAPREIAELIGRFDVAWERAVPIALRPLGL